MMNYNDAMDYIESLSKYGSVLGLDNMKELMRRLSNVQDKLSFIHVAGTNGKGSVSAFLSSMLIESGLKVGTYSSPSVFSYLEKIKIGRRILSKAKFAAILEKVAKEADAMEIHPTQFEVETACAFLAFYEAGCDVVVLECGLGGDSDATNIIKTGRLAVITSISLDHMDYLGTSLSDIAQKKAGIIKDKMPLVTCRQEKEAEDILKAVCEAKGSSIYIADSDRDIDIIKDEYGDICFTAKGFDGCLGDDTLKMSMSLSGEHQLENVSVAIMAALVLKLDYRAIVNGVKKAVNPGRLSKLMESPLLIMDGAHNIDAILSLKRSIEKYFKKKRLIFIIGVFRDKSYDKMMEIIAPMAEQIITVATPFNKRALPAIELAECIMKYNKKVSAAASVEEALELSLLFSAKKDIILAFGSLSYLGLLKQAVEARNK